MAAENSFVGNSKDFKKAVTWKTWGAYHLHGKPGNSGWKMKCFIPFHLKQIRNYTLHV